MKQDNINYTVVGLFVVTISIVFLIVLYLITGKVSDADRYYTILQDVSGINNGTAITYKGYKIGQLIEIEPVFKDNVTQFNLTLSIKSGWVVTEGSSIYITKTGLLSDSQLNISEGKSKNILAIDSHITGKQSNDVMTVIKSMSENINNLSSNVITPMITKLRDDIDVFSGTMSNDLPALTKNLNVLVLKLQKNSDVIDSVLNSNNQTKISDLIDSADVMLNNLESMSESLNALVNKNKDNIDKSISSMSATTQLMNNKLESILYQLEVTSQNINDFSNQIKNNPGALIRNKTQTDTAIR